MKKLGKLSLSELKNELPIIGNDEARGLAGGTQILGGHTYYTLQEYHDLAVSGKWNTPGYVIGIGGTVGAYTSDPTTPDRLDPNLALALKPYLSGDNNFAIMNGSSGGGGGSILYGSIIGSEYSGISNYRNIFSNPVGGLYVNNGSNYGTLAEFKTCYSNALKSLGTDVSKVSLVFDGLAIEAYYKGDPDGSGPLVAGQFMGSWRDDSYVHPILPIL